MSQHVTTLPARPPYRSELLDRLHEDWDRLFQEIGAGTVQRELDGALPFEAVRRLKNWGFGALRVPRAYGGLGATWPELTALWIELAAADANLPQAFRGHFAFAEDRLWQHRRGHDQSVWFERFVDGEIAGNAWTEVGGTTIDTLGDRPGSRRSTATGSPARSTTRPAASSRSGPMSTRAATATARRTTSRSRSSTRASVG